jgi:sialidase-1
MKQDRSTSHGSTLLLATAAMTFVFLTPHQERVEAAEPQMTTVFTSGTDGYRAYCIPSLICTPKGVLLAFCEGRKLWSEDESPTDLVLRRSVDGGKTWLPMQIVVKAVPEAAADPTVVYDNVTDTVLLVYDRWPEHIKDHWPPDGLKRDPGLGRNSVTAWVTTSRDDGATWSAPVDITAMTKKPDWTRIGHGPGVGIQMRSGRLVIPCFEHKWPGFGWGESWNYAIYSDDHGKHWKMSGNEVGSGVDETQIVELADGTLMLNMRGWSDRRFRVGATSKDGGQTWSEPFDVHSLPDPCCQASILRYTWPDEHGGKSRILFSNPASTREKGRNTGTVRLSYDDGKTWPVAKVLESGEFGYSCLAVMPDGSICCLFDVAARSKLTFARFTLEWLTDGKDSWELTASGPSHSQSARNTER